MEQTLASALVDQGLRAAFGVTGSGPSWRLISALEKLGARYYPASHEGAAAIMAGAASRAGHRISAAIAIKGPGLANMLPGIAFNHFENVPVVTICEAYGPSVPAARMHKRLDQRMLLQPVCKGSISLAQVPARFDALVEIARAEVPGPVHVDLNDAVEPTVSWAAVPPAQRSPADQLSALRLLERCRRPLLIVGSLAARKNLAGNLSTCRVPLLTTAAAKGLVDERGSHALGVYTGDGKALAAESSAIEQADLVIGVGLRNLEILSPKAFGRPLILVDEIGGAVQEGFGDAERCVNPDPAWLADFFAAVAARAWGDELVHDAWQKIDAAFASDTWLPAACFHRINALPPGFLTVLDTGSFCTVAEHVLRAAPDRPLLGSNNGRYMGGAIPSAVGAAIAAPGRPVLCVTGDGGMRMYPSELRLAVSERLPVCVLLMSDGRYGSVACASDDAAMSARAVTIAGSDWARAVEGFGCRATVVNGVAEFERAFGDWRGDGPLLIECRFPPQPYAEMVRDLR
jgi:thiamine pyrophosphate-dependent acetolactate synthase large subunit-like protein